MYPSLFGGRPAVSVSAEDVAMALCVRVCGLRWCRECVFTADRRPDPLSAAGVALYRPLAVLVLASDGTGAALDGTGTNRSGALWYWYRPLTVPERR